LQRIDFYIRSLRKILAKVLKCSDMSKYCLLRYLSLHCQSGVFVNENIGVRLISDIYRQFFLFGFPQGFRSFCADRKNQRALRMGAFLTAAEADDFWGCGTRSLRSLKQSSPLSKSH
jgi:hypothetical protein